MNVVGRQMSRSAVHHQCQYSENFLDSSSKWFQSTSLSQDFGLYGSRSIRNRPRSGSERSPPDVFSASLSLRSSSMRKYGDDQVLPSELSPGLLDLYSFDTELLPEMHVTSPYDDC